MPFNPEELDLLGEAEEVEIETRAEAGVSHRTVTWIVVDASEPYVRSVRGDRGRWYREATVRPDVVIHVNGTAIPARAVSAGDHESVDRISAALKAKYGRDPAIRTMLRPHTLETNLRLEPAPNNQRPE